MQRHIASTGTAERWTLVASLNRLVQPLNDTLDYTGIKTNHRKYVLLFFLREMAERKRSFWGWTTEEWIESIERRRSGASAHRRHRLSAL